MCNRFGDYIYGFQESPDKCRDITTAILNGR